MSNEIIAALIGVGGAIIGAVLTYLLQKRAVEKKSLTLLVERAKPLVSIPDMVTKKFEILVDGQRIKNIYAADYAIINSGNKVINNVEVSLDSPNQTFVLSLDVDAESARKVEGLKPSIEGNSIYFRMPYINPNETVRGTIFFTEDPGGFVGHFRQPDVTFEFSEKTSNLSVATSIIVGVARTNPMLDLSLRLLSSEYRRLVS